MKIQCVMNLINRRHGYDEEAKLQFSDFSAPESFDDYDLNVISLQSNEIWRNSSGITETESVDYSEDFTSLKKIINKTKKSKVLLLYPRNSKFKTRYSGGNSYRVEYPLKDILGSLDFILKQLLDNYSEKIYFECNNVSLQNSKLKADFCFENSNKSFLDSSSGKCVGKCLNETVFLSTVVIEEYSQNIFKKLYDLAFPSEKVSAPDWFLEEKFFDDDRLLDMKQEKEVQVDEIKREIERIELSLEKNNSIKSILYTSGDELVEQVFNIFEEMLEIDLSEFEDKNKEDFEFTISGKTFIGEIKGVKSNIKNANVSQLDVHLQEYVDSHENVDIETLFSILVMNYQNNRKPSERDQINSQQISLAQRNKSLIIDSVSLLKLLEKFRRNEISREQVIEKISDKYNGIIQV